MLLQMIVYLLSTVQHDGYADCHNTVADVSIYAFRDARRLINYKDWLIIPAYEIRHNK